MQEINMPWNTEPEIWSAFVKQIKFQKDAVVKAQYKK